MITKHNNKFLTFMLDEEDYAIPILDVKEIIGVMEITHIPKMPNYIKGVVNLRGKIIPVVDLRLKFELVEKAYDELTCIIVVEIHRANGNKLCGFIVDRVSEVQDILPENIEDISDYGNDVKQELLKGLGKVKEKVIMILNSNRIFSEDEKAHLDIHNEEVYQEVK